MPLIQKLLVAVAVACLHPDLTIGDGSPVSPNLKDPVHGSEPPPDAPRIYVYDLPRHLNARSHRRCELSQYSAEGLILQALQGKARFVEDPSQADFFWVPATLYCRGGKAVTSKIAAKTLRATVSYVSSRWPHFKAGDGSDHIFTVLAQSDTCSDPAFAIPELANAIILTHWGLASEECSLPGKRLIVPTPFHDKYTSSDKDLTRSKRERPIHLLATGVSDNFPHPPGAWNEQGNLVQSIKHRTSHMLHGRYSGHVIQTEEWAPNHYIRYNNAHFCLVALNNLGIQLKLAAQAGCVPVLIEEEAMPWQHLLPYDLFSLSVPEKELFRIPFDLATLRVKGSEMADMRKRLTCVKTFLSWRYKSAKAADMLACDLRMRLDPSVVLKLDIDQCTLSCASATEPGSSPLWIDQQL